MAADASQMMEGGKYPTSSLVLPCIAKVIESVDPATKILFPERTVDGHVTVPTDLLQQLCVVVQHYLKCPITGPSLTSPPPR